jgi:hypothetical protein
MLPHEWCGNVKEYEAIVDARDHSCRRARQHERVTLLAVLARCSLFLRSLDSIGNRAAP